MSRLRSHGYLLAWVACVAAGAALGLMLAPAVRRGAPTECANRVVVSEDEPARGSNELEQLRRQVAALRREQAALQKRIEETTPAGDKPEEHAAVHQEPEDPFEGLSEQEQMDLIREEQQAAFEHQAVDPGWRASREALVRTALNAPRWTELGYKLTSAECRSTTCRIELTAPPNARMSFGNMLFDPPFEGQVFFFFTGENAVVAYAARPQ